jgi:putative flippase GtrA
MFFINTNIDEQLFTFTKYSTDNRLSLISKKSIARESVVLIGISPDFGFFTMLNNIFLAVYFFCHSLRKFPKIIFNGITGSKFNKTDQKNTIITTDTEAGMSENSGIVETTPIKANCI